MLRVLEDEPETPVLRVDHSAKRNLDFIRQTLERATAFTAVPGAGLVANGILALGASACTYDLPNWRPWLISWLLCATAGFLIGTGSMIIKARRAGVSLLSGPGRRFLVALLPPFVAGGLLTHVLVAARDFELLPGVWLLMYGVGVLTGGAFAIRPVVVMGGIFFALGSIALLLPAVGLWLMAIGFGLTHIVFGALIAQRYGG